MIIGLIDSSSTIRAGFIFGVASNRLGHEVFQLHIYLFSTDLYALTEAEFGPWQNYKSSKQTDGHKISKAFPNVELIIYNEA
jgi:hypothetical protein